ncbi:hypothetical protein I317_04276 [Kwoniella heveanensis CBS 569]|nr:hypothetical protein I317_04276 [Kwoniella heveanensis CBS 569]
MDVLDQPISALNVSRTLKTALLDAGYKILGDIGELSPNDLSSELGIPSHQAEDLFAQIAALTAGPSKQPEVSGSQQAFHPSHIRASTAADLLSSAYLPRFSTQSSSLDNLIASFRPVERSASPAFPSKKGKEKAHAGSIVPGMTIEVCGPPGGGKTTVVLGIVLSARMATVSGRGSMVNGGDEVEEAGEVLLIDTEGGIAAERIHAMAEILTRTNVSPRDLTRGIHFIRIHTQVQMIGFIHTLDEWLDEHPNVNLVVIDTLSYHFRQPGLEMGARRRVMELVKQKIGQATTVHRCAVVVCNQLATKLLTFENKPANFDTGDRAVLMPQLGDAWTTGNTLRLLLFRNTSDDELRYAYGSMSGSDKNESFWAPFDIDSNGLPCDIPAALSHKIPPSPPPFDKTTA